MSKGMIIDCNRGNFEPAITGIRADQDVETDRLRLYIDTGDGESFDFYLPYILAEKCKDELEVYIMDRNITLDEANVEGSRS